jgi:hypothetical protein
MLVAFFCHALELVHTYIEGGTEHPRKVLEHLELKLGGQVGAAAKPGPTSLVLCALLVRPT